MGEEKRRIETFRERNQETARDLDGAEGKEM